MNDLISRLSEIRSNYNCFDEKEEPYYRALSEAIQLVSAQLERKKGKWGGNTKDESWKCSECGFIFYSVGFYKIYNTKFRMRFCPNCGAQMEES